MSRLRVSPFFFSSLQWLSVAVPLALLVGLVALFAVATQGERSFWMSLLESGFYVLTCGGIALMYLGWWISLTFRGIVATPKIPWELNVVDGQVVVKSKRLEVLFPVSRPRDFVQVWDGGFDQLRGLEDKGLVVDFGFLFRIVVPGSSRGFDAALAEIGKARLVRVREIE